MCAALAVYAIRSWNKSLTAPHHPGSTMIPCLEAFIVQTAEQQHPHWCSNVDDIIGYTGESVQFWLDCVRRTDFEQVSVSSTPPRKCIGTMLWGVHRSNSRAAASPLIFNSNYLSRHMILQWFKISPLWNIHTPWDRKLHEWDPAILKWCKTLPYISKQLYLNWGF